MTLNTIANLPTIATTPPNNALIGFKGNAAAFPAKGILLIVLMELFTKLYGAFTIAKRAPEAFCNKKAPIAKTMFQTSPIVMRGLGALTTGGVLSLFDFFKIINSFLMCLKGVVMLCLPCLAPLGRGRRVLAALALVAGARSAWLNLAVAGRYWAKAFVIALG